MWFGDDGRKAIIIYFKTRFAVDLMVVFFNNITSSVEASIGPYNNREMRNFVSCENKKSSVISLIIIAEKSTSLTSVCYQAFSSRATFY
jgi:hypothetical protein